MRCSHCKGTGEVPNKIVLECISCQCKVTVDYKDTGDLLAKSENVLCAQCKVYSK